MSELIVALDVVGKEQAEAFVDLLGDAVDYYKVGYALFFSWGPDAVRFLKDKGKRVFLDLKFYDIPNTMKNAAVAAVGLGVDMLNFHISAGKEAALAMKDAVLASKGARPLLIGVTRLTSESAGEEEVLEMAKRAKEWGIDGVVCSALESRNIKEQCGGLLTVCPGIAVDKQRQDDQKRVVSIDRLAEYNPEYIVVGRPILYAEDPVSVVDYIKGYL